MKWIPQQAFRAEFKEPAVQAVRDGQKVPASGREVGISRTTVRNWVKAAAAGKLVAGREPDGHAGAKGIDSA